MTSAEAEGQSREVKPYDFDVDELWEYLERIFAERVVMLDGGMGTEL